MPDSEGDYLADRPMNSDEEAVAAALSPSTIERIDRALLSHATPYGRKVAMVVGLAMRDLDARIAGLPDLFYARRVRALVERGDLVSEGNLASMRYSEVRLP